MDGMLGIFQSVSSAKHDDIAIYLKGFDEHQCFQKSTSGRGEFISHITSLLSNTSTRYEGLLLLEELLKQCTLDILEQKGTLWAGFCIKTCNQQNLFSCVPLACRALGMLVEKSVDVPDLSKAFTSHLLGNFFDSLKNAPTSGAHAILECVEICLRIYPAACGPHRSAAEKYVTTFIDCRNLDLVRDAGKCLHLLQQIRGGSTVGVNYQETWQKLQLGLIGNLHEILDNIFADCPELHDNSDQYEKWNFPALKLNDNPIIRASQLLNRYKNLMTYLKVVLSEPFPVSKLIMPRRILNFIQRGLAINCKLLAKSPTSNNLAVGALLPEFHIELFNLLDVMISILKTNMALYVHACLSFVLETLKWTSSGKSSGFTKSFGSLRIAAYNSLALWNNTFKHGSCCELIAEYLIEQIKNDIMPFQNEVTLKVLSGSKKHMTKKARRLLHKAQNEQSNLAQMHSKAFNPHNTKIIFSDAGNQQVCSAALICLKSIVQSATTFLKPVIVKDIMDTVFSIALHALNNDDGLQTQLYSDYTCRLHLYETVYVTLDNPHPLCPPPIQLVIEILTTAQAKDRNTIVRSSCSQHLNIVEKIIHPQKESLYYPVDKNDMKNALKNDKSINERNTSTNRDNDDQEEDSESEIEVKNVDDDQHSLDIYFTDGLDDTDNQKEESKSTPSKISSDDLEVIEQISLHSSQDESPDVMVVDNETVEIVVKTIEHDESETIVRCVDESDDKSADECSEPLAKKKRTISDSGSQSIDKIEMENQIKVQENSENIAISVEDRQQMENDETTEKDVVDQKENENDFVDKCLEDFVDELNDKIS